MRIRRVELAGERAWKQHYAWESEPDAVRGADDGGGAGYWEPDCGERGGVEWTV